MTLILLLAVTAGRALPLQGQNETLTYHLFANKGKIGKWVISREREGDRIVYESRKEVAFSLRIVATRTVTVQRTVFRNGQLEEAQLTMWVDGDLRREVQIIRGDGYYRYLEEGKAEKRIEQPVTMTSLTLFFGPPDGTDRVFFERLGAFSPLRKIEENSYGIRLANGEENRYDYFEGRLARAVLEDGVLHTYMRLRRVKGEEEVD